MVDYGSVYEAIVDCCVGTADSADEGSGCGAADDRVGSDAGSAG